MVGYRRPLSRLEGSPSVALKGAQLLIDPEPSRGRLWIPGLIELTDASPPTGPARDAPGAAWGNRARNRHTDTRRWTLAQVDICRQSWRR